MTGMMVILNMCVAEKTTPISFHLEIKVDTALPCGS